MGKEQIPLEDYIDKIIHFHAGDQIVQRGNRIFRAGNVKLISFDEKRDIFKFRVLGNHLYDVKITGLLSHNVRTDCTCPYDWGSMCKHTVAALRYLEKNEFQDRPAGVASRESQAKPGKKKKPVQVLRQKEGFEIPNYRMISENFAGKNYQGGVREFAYATYQFNRLEVEKLTYAENSITLLINLDGDYFTVKFTRKNNKVYIASDKGKQTDKLNLSEALVLFTIAISKSPDLLDKIFSGYIVDEQNRILEKFGLPGKKFDDYFDTKFSKEGLYWETKDNASGLLPVKGIKNDPLIGLVKEINGQDSALDFVKVHTNKQKRMLGFIVEPDYDEDYEQNIHTIKPFVAKSNKAQSALISLFEYYEDADPAEFELTVSDEEQELIKICSQLNASWEDDVEPRDIYRLQSRIVELLANERFVYRKGDSDNEYDYSYRLRKKDLHPLKVSPDPLDAFFEVTSDREFIHLDLKITVGEKDVVKENLERTGEDNFLYFLDNVLFTAKSFNTGKYINQFISVYKIVKSHKTLFYSEIIEPLSKNIGVVFHTDEYDHETVELDFDKKQVFLSEKEGHILITPRVEYRNGMAAVLYQTGDILSEENGKIITYKRNFELEDDFVDFIGFLHPDFKEQKSEKVFYLSYEDFAENFWFYKFFDALHANEIEIYGLKELKNFKYSPHRGKIVTSVKSGIDWFEVNVDITFGNNKVSLKDIRNAVINKDKYIQLKDGSVGILPNEWFHKLEKYFRHGEVKGEKLAVSGLKFSIIDELFDEISDAEVLREIEDKRKKLAAFKEIAKTRIPKEIKADLRHYQKEGVNWLNFLNDMGWGGILADDMGLGKTLQVLAFIQQIIKKDKTPNLIVVPTTLLFNWEAEIKKFAPKLKAYHHYGLNRKKNTEEFRKYPLVFTTYGILMRDIEMLKDFRFNYVILDESQAIKNPASRRFKAAGLLKANNRLALTGTPIENSTFDLYAQMSFVNRGFFGSTNAFKTNFSNPVDKEGNEMIASELQRMINPFILGRTKEMVATELPPKTVDVIYCEMDSAQRKVYDAYRNEYRNKLLGNIEEKGLGKSKMMVLEALTRLRQICDSPLLLNDEEVTVSDSVKIRELVRHINDKTANHKILVFSQFVKMLGLIKTELDKYGIDYEYLDGQSTQKQRQQSVNRFQENPDLRVFLISLKAGGTGINLTAADYVYVVDPWWNPAVENQAIDRCYRIGQDKNVFAYRMICTDTVEEKILQLQQKKVKIATDIIQADESIMKNLSVKDIESLFS